jgi:Tfp pilus assembly protein PilN
VKAVNLLPETDQPRQRPAGPAAGRRPYAVVGVLGALLVMVTLYVLTANQVTSREDKADQLEVETREAQAQVRALGPFGDFSQVAQTRTAAVKQLTESRFDWERLLRELSLVLPDDAWLTDADAALKPGESAGSTGAGGASSSGSSGSASAGSEASSAEGPAMTLKGCAKRQPAVAELMVRVKRMHRVEDVTLAQSSKGDSAGGEASSSECGSSYAFELLVSFSSTAPVQATPPGRKRVPVSLGGGA